MIFITIGTQEPFDRLIKALDTVAKEFSEEEFVAQVSNTEYQVQNMNAVNFIAPNEFNELFKKARLIISHAGMGTIITALQKRKPILVMPRKAALGEHRNEHQLATAKKMYELGYVYVAFDENELVEKLRALLRKEDIDVLHNLGEFASPELLGSLKNDLDYFERL